MYINLSKHEGFNKFLNGCLFTGMISFAILVAHNHFMGKSVALASADVPDLVISDQAGSDFTVFADKMDEQLIQLLVGEADNMDTETEDVVEVNPEPDYNFSEASSDLSAVQLALDITYEIESDGGVNLVGDDGKAIGPLHIHMPMVKDVNRIVNICDLDYPRFTSGDRYDLDKSCQMFAIYQWYYGKEYSKETGDMPTPETYVRMWNGGPKGYESSATDRHWQKSYDWLVETYGPSMAEELASMS